MIGFGDSSGDVPFLPEIAKRGGLAVWFNPTPGISDQMKGRPGSARTVFVAAHSMKHLKNLLREALRHDDLSSREHAVKTWIKAHNAFRRRAMAKGGSPGITYYVTASKIPKNLSESLERARAKVRGKETAEKTKRG